MNRSAFNSQFTPLFNGKAKNGKVDAQGFHSLGSKFMECRQKLGHDIQELSLEMVKGFLPAGQVPVNVAVDLAWELCNDG